MQALTANFRRMQRLRYMRDFRDAKAMAQTLREGLKDKQTSLTHSESLELIARMFGVKDWNVLSARIEKSQAEAAVSPVPENPNPPMGFVISTREDPDGPTGTLTTEDGFTISFSGRTIDVIGPDLQKHSLIVELALPDAENNEEPATG
jgi:hypothetical protein